MVCPTPTPPVIVNAPVDVVVDAVELVINKLFVKVLLPAKDWSKVETNPVAAIPAIGMLKVCVEPEDTMLKSDPLIPVAKYCVELVRLLR